jgi:hypothetical protein
VDIFGVVANDTILCVPLSTCSSDTTFMLDSAVRWSGTRIVIENVAFSPGYHRQHQSVHTLPHAVLEHQGIPPPATYLIPARECASSKARLKVRAGHVLRRAVGADVAAAVEPRQLVGDLAAKLQVQQHLAPGSQSLGKRQRNTLHTRLVRNVHHVDTTPASEANRTATPWP